MSKTPSITEQELQGLNPCGLDDAFLSRLAACAEDGFTKLSAEETAYENSLRSVRPRNIQSALLETLHGRTGDAPFAVDEKIVLFNKSNKAKTAASKQAKAPNIIRFNLAAAAAVALLGSLAALMLPDKTPSDVPTASSETPVESFVPLATSPSNVAPAGYNRTLVGTSDEGVIWKNETQPFRVLRHTFSDRITTAGENGEPVQKEQPHIEYSLIPEKVD